MHLNTEITARNHDAVAELDNLIERARICHSRRFLKLEQTPHIACQHQCQITTC